MTHVDLLTSFAWKLKAATGLDVYPAPKPAGASTPCLTYQIISDPMQDQNHSSGGQIHMSRVQIGHVGDYKTIRPYVVSLQKYLEGNKTDFLCAMSDGIYIETQEAEDLWVLIKGYYIQWKGIDGR